MAFRIRASKKKEIIDNKENIIKPRENINKIIKLEYDTIVYDKNIGKWKILKQGTILNS
jgi:hypothetical protein